MTRDIFRFTLVFCLAAALSHSPAAAAQKAAAVSDDGYSGKVLEKIMASGKLRVNQDTRVRLYLDDEGRLTDCRKISGGEAQPICAAAKAAQPFGQPPYGLATNILLSFWSGNTPTETRKKDAAAENKSGHSAGAAIQAATSQTAANDKYLAKIRREIRNVIYIPKETQKGVYHAAARMRIDKTGAITDSAIIKSSGDARLDKYVLQGIARAAKVTPPPADLRNPVEITFTLTRN